MSRMVIDDEMWFGLEKLLPKPKGRHGNHDRLHPTTPDRDIYKERNNVERFFQKIKCFSRQTKSTM